MVEVLLSIIIPVYNVENYLAECLESVMSQRLSNCEVICVNDGSTDTSRQILYDYKDKYNVITIIDRENGGLIKARNTGYNVAVGKYIYYLDSDDYIFPNTLKKLLNLCIINDLDVLLFNSRSDKGKRYFTPKCNIDQIVDGISYFNKFFNENGFFPPSVQWLYFYKKSFLDRNNIYFPEDNLQEDEPFTIQVFYKAKKAMGFNMDVVYHRVFREGSITQRAHLPHLIDAKVAWRRIVTFLDDNNCNEPLFFKKVFQLYQNTIEKLTSENLIQFHQGFFGESDFKNMKRCIISKEQYKYFWYYKHGYSLFKWYTNGKTLSLIRKFLNRVLSLFFKIFICNV